MASLECNNKHLVELNQSNGVSRILLNDPARKNALSKDMLICLIATLEKIQSDDKQKVVILRGAGGVFCSGADLKWMREGLHQTEEQNKADAELFYRTFDILNNFPKPIIIWLEKYAMGGAIGLVACADYVIADKDAKMAFTEVKLGLVPATIAPFIVNKIGLSQARALMLSALPFTAKTAKKIGLIHEVGSHKELAQRIDELSEHFKANSNKAMASTKHLLNQLSKNNFTEANKLLCIEKIAESRGTDEGQEGVKAFFEKRRPSWYK
ncbi:enoyl-CoA hydratase/isomerase family protein [Carboxylicivirga marina]|uniref:Enoyl-CoA hydratase/isomerase family protein n=1 Tax=Carboxylicivirga marina TaxID=2800988 RepID=A0ABS1HDP4_9BACT|nr:enoyl-CoA hydratase-related protein [Carboxylicivirga marina]MBK3515756.1 enoyl-CoA hydratase/isomerase family protein [Carboxylicivirga marina]